MRVPLPLRVSSAAVLLSTLVALPQNGSEARQTGKPESRRTWMDYGGAPDNARYVTFDQITKDERRAAARSRGRIPTQDKSRTSSARSLSTT